MLTQFVTPGEAGVSEELTPRSLHGWLSLQPPYDAAHGRSHMPQVIIFLAQYFVILGQRALHSPSTGDVLQVARQALSRFDSVVDEELFRERGATSVTPAQGSLKGHANSPDDGQHWLRTHSNSVDGIQGAIPETWESSLCHHIGNPEESTTHDGKYGSPD